MLKFLIFSKNRACQLDLLIRSIQKYCQINPGNYTISILYTYDDKYKAAYNECIMRNLKLNWIKETNFQQQVLENINTGKNSVCLLTDDTVFFRNFNFPFNHLTNSNVFSWRLGYNTYIQDIPSSRLQPPLNPSEYYGDLIVWNPNSYQECYNYGYPFSFDGHVYSGNTLYNILKDKSFKNTNEIEGILHSQRSTVERIFANTHSSCVNIPCNNLSGLTGSGDIFPYSMEKLNDMYLRGLRIKFLENNIRKIPVLSCHQEFEFEFYSET